MQSFRYDPEVNSQPIEILLYHMQVQRLLVDQEHVALYKNKVSLVYKIIIYTGRVYPIETTLHVYEEVKTK